MMIRRTYMGGLAAVLLLAATPAAGLDPLRCEALGMRKEGQWYECLGRCERRLERRADRLGADAAAHLSACRGECERHYNEAMDGLDAREVCSATAADPDPNRCRARLLRIGATRMMCRSQCAADAGAYGAECTRQCDDRCASAVGRIMAKDMCHGQPDAGVCIDHVAVQ